MLSEYKPQKFTIDEYDKQISEKLKKKHPELFMSQEESEEWLKVNKELNLDVIEENLTEVENNVQKLEK